MQCQYCRKPLSRVPGQYQCPHCRMMNIPQTSAEDPEVSRLSDATSDKPVERIDVGFLNPIFGGGIAKTSVNMIAGQPGAGKTTLFLQTADFILTQNPTFTDVLYIANEQSKEELMNVYATRLGIKNSHRILVYNAMGGLRRPIDEILSQYKPSLAILDSLTKLVGEDLVLGAEFTMLFKEHTARQAIPTLIVNQVNKSGDHAGLNKMLHAGDSILHLECDEVTGQRVLYSTKNRFGPAPVSVGMKMLGKDADRPGYLVLDEDYQEQ
jgi:DNA repair protein RadA/Sms